MKDSIENRDPQHILEDAKVCDWMCIYSNTNEESIVEVMHPEGNHYTSTIDTRYIKSLVGVAIEWGMIQDPDDEPLDSDRSIFKPNPIYRKLND